MSGKTVFIAGAYGTGKSTLCARLASMLNIPAYSAGDLISERSGELYGANKAVSDKTQNQNILVECIRDIHVRYSRILLAGHFCIFNADNQVDVLPMDVFGQIEISHIVLLEADKEQIAKHLRNRDEKEYPLNAIQRLLHMECEQSKKVAELLKCSLLIHQMTFTDTDTERIIAYLAKGA